MKKMKIYIILAFVGIMFGITSCSDNDDDAIAIKNVKISLSYEDGSNVKAGVKVSVRTVGEGSDYEAITDSLGVAEFDLPIGSYEFTVTDTKSLNGKLTIYNGLINTIIDQNWDNLSMLTIEMLGSTKSQIIIKELYEGGCPSDEEGDVFRYGQYITLYNNSIEPVDLKNLCIGSWSSNSYGMDNEIHAGDTEAYWFKEDWSPVGVGYFYFPNSTILEPFKEIVVVLSSAIDNSATYSQAVDLTSPDNYVCYDVEDFDNSYYYPSPASTIDPSHYLNAVKYGLGNAMIVSYASPSFYLFYPEGNTPESLGTDTSNDDYWKDNDKFPRKKIYTSWIQDALEVFAAGREADNKKRVNPKQDAGYVYMTTAKGYSIYCNVDKDATESIEGNKEKLVYNYSMGTENDDLSHGTTDPSGIDAEASIANGATIIFMDTNNSTTDFHQRKKAALRK